jgi:hypothetical protein
VEFYVYVYALACINFVITEKLYTEWEKGKVFFLQFINIGENTNIFLIRKQPDVFVNSVFIFWAKVSLFELYSIE